MKVLICDDHALYRAGLHAVLSTTYPGVEIIEAGDGAAAMRAFEANPDIDLLICDLRLPVLDGIGVITEARARSKTLPIILHTAVEEAEDIAQVMDAGATGYVSKARGLDAFTTTVAEALRGNQMMPAEMAVRIREFRERQREFSETITRRQLDVLTLCAEGMSNREIGERIHVSEATVKAHLASVMRLLNKNDRTGCVTEAIRRGWIKATPRI